MDLGTPDLVSPTASGVRRSCPYHQGWVGAHAAKDWPADQPAVTQKVSAFYVTLMFFQNLTLMIELEDGIFTDRFPLRLAIF